MLLGEGEKATPVVDPGEIVGERQRAELLFLLHRHATLRIALPNEDHCERPEREREQKRNHQRAPLKRIPFPDERDEDRDDETNDRRHKKQDQAAVGGAPPRRGMCPSANSSGSGECLARLRDHFIPSRSMARSATISG
jgi:hypothetical protein